MLIVELIHTMITLIELDLGLHKSRVIFNESLCFDHECMNTFQHNLPFELGMLRHIDTCDVYK